AGRWMKRSKIRRKSTIKKRMKMTHRRNAAARQQPNRRRFLSTGLCGGLVAATLTEETLSSPAADRPFELSELTIGDLQEGMRTGQYTSRSLAERYLARIDAIDRQGPSLRSV